MNSALEERIAQGSKEGLEFLEKTRGTPLTFREALRLFRHGLLPSIYALLISDIRALAKQNGAELAVNNEYADVVESLKNVVPEYRAIRTAGCYAISVYRLSATAEREMIKDDLFRDLINGVPYAGNLLVTILNFEGKTKISYDSNK